MPSVCCSSQRQPPTSGARHLAAADRAHVRIVGVARHLARAAAGQHRELAVAREGRRVVRAHADEAVAVQRREARALPDRDVERGDVRVADERLGVRGDHVEVEERDRLRRAEPALQALDDVDLRVGEQRRQVGGALPRVAGDVVVAGVDAGERASRGSRAPPTTRRRARSPSARRTGSPARQRRSCRPVAAAVRRAWRQSRDLCSIPNSTSRTRGPIVVEVVAAFLDEHRRQAERAEQAAGLAEPGGGSRRAGSRDRPPPHRRRAGRRAPRRRCSPPTRPRGERRRATARRRCRAPRGRSGSRRRLRLAPCSSAKPRKCGNQPAPGSTCTEATSTSLRSQKISCVPLP